MSAAACLWWALYCLWKFHDSGGRARWAAGTGAALALLMGCRATYVLGAGAVALLLFAPVETQAPGKPRKGNSAWLAVAVAAAGGIALLAYNRARFGSWTEFGMSYMLFGEDYRGIRYFNPAFIPFNASIYLFSMPQWGPYFPFVHPFWSPRSPGGIRGVRGDLWRVLHDAGPPQWFCGDDSFGALEPPRFAGGGGHPPGRLGPLQPCGRPRAHVRGERLPALHHRADRRLDGRHRCRPHGAPGPGRGWPSHGTHGPVPLAVAAGLLDRGLRVARVRGIPGLHEADGAPGLHRHSRMPSTIPAPSRLARERESTSGRWGGPYGARVAPSAAGVDPVLMAAGRPQRVNQLLLGPVEAGAARLILADNEHIVLESPPVPGSRRPGARAPAAPLALPAARASLLG